MSKRFFVVGALAFVLSGCGHTSAIISNPSSAASVPKRHAAPQTPISHVVIIVQENRSFDNLFNGFPNADTVRFGTMLDGTVVPLTPRPLVQAYDLEHSQPGFFLDYDSGKMDGFSAEQNPLHDPLYPYAYTQQSDVQPYWDMASQYTLADRMFESANGPSFGAHQFLIAGQTGNVNNTGHSPWGCDGPRPECFDYPTLADLMDNAGVTWRSYSPGTLSTPKTYSGWQAFDAIQHIRYGVDWTNGDIVMPEARVLKDIAHGALAQVSWVVPTKANSDHAGSGAFDQGPAWVSSIVNAIGSSPYWGSTVIFVVWDDWGGWYDHVAPAELYKDGLGIRVPLIVISPYAKTGYVSKVDHEFGSILHFTESTFGLGSLGTADARSDDLSDCFNFAQRPLSFKLIHAPALVDVPEEMPDDY